MVDETPRPTPQKGTREPESEREPEEWSAGKIAGAILGVCAIVAALILALSSCGSDSPKSINTLPDAPTSANTACDGLSVTYLDPHTGEDVITGGIPKDPTESKQFIADRATDPSVFQWYYNHSSLVDILNQPKISDPWSLVTEPHMLGACWTKEGQKMYDDWHLVWMMTDAHAAPLPATGANAGVASDGSAIQSVGAIPAGTATEFTYRDANGKPISKTLVRNECGNVVVPTPVPGVPSKPSVPQTTPHTVTTPPPPPTTETPPPPTTTTPPPPTTPTTTTPPPPPTTTTLPPKVSTTNPAKPPGIVPLPLDPVDTLQPSPPTLTNRQTVPIPTDAPPVSQVPRTFVPPVETPVITIQNTPVPVPVPVPTNPGTNVGEAPPVP